MQLFNSEVLFKPKGGCELKRGHSLKVTLDFLEFMVKSEKKTVLGVDKGSLEIYTIY